MFHLVFLMQPKKNPKLKQIEDLYDDISIKRSINQLDNYQNNLENYLLRIKNTKILPIFLNEKFLVTIASFFIKGKFDIFFITPKPDDLNEKFKSNKSILLL